MIIAFKIILLIIMFSSFSYAAGEKEKSKRDNMTAICIASIIGSLVAFIMI
ncbi:MULTISPECIES: hypothetical protein [Bacillus]|uniref:hypothetical protein n=1 Tax=Bacillus TaxID=1386 RepID=UPI00038E5846|nr:MULTISPECIES: hypothetical protein [Bacillus]AOP14600.1 hypothetical protein BL1202_01652 [Bacillus licheniformis]EQM28570.1 hypothetical protein N399_08025 [Bacillus licheniformis CG-B52]MBU8800412.1 hypothetical protein [Bacillus licheniformis]MCM3212769.1 hypothetical protein [Bacillus licheniformis]MCM3288374.1 hypothetical protein [Bacillus licheniformis]